MSLLYPRFLLPWKAGMRICLHTETTSPRIGGQELVVDALACLYPASAAAQRPRTGTTAKFTREPRASADASSAKARENRRCT